MIKTAFVPGPIDFLQGLLATEIAEYDSLAKRDYPRYNVKRTSDEVVLEIAVPGFDRDQLKVEVSEQLLIVSGNTNEPEDSETETAPVASYTSKGFSTAKFTRKWTFKGLQIDDVALLNGVLTIKMKSVKPDSSVFKIN